jgi:hypothetical protein
MTRCRQQKEYNAVRGEEARRKITNSLTRKSVPAARYRLPSV